jgi:ribosomal protein S12 methylthiotransferase accessory factor YcaO
MEIVERRCAFASFDRDRVVGQARQSRVLRGSLEELRRDGLRTLDPNSLCLEVPYRNESLYWIEAVIREAGSVSPIWVPAQSVFLFCNLDESSLYSGLGSTGLAAGNTVEEARLAALLEVIERDSEAVSVFNPARCFRIVAEDPAIGELLAAYHQGGIDVMCQELDNPFAVPCYKCFVVGPQGQIARGTGAHLDGRKALLSALTETPYPFPYGPPSAVGPPQWPVARFEQLPVYTTGDTVEDLALLERVLNQSGYCPIYVDLTREDLGFPVVRALVPGLQTMADFDRYSRVSPRLFANYLKVFRLCG